ncbi:Omega-amidase,chloroplastic [Capsicum baccatum]|uniref:Omega-amidase,chloroplastic n=1 Tax=Capsicum baccatum TaxID=33114 RepID=A0A2G2UZ98_CAPBA|nr:Omega-amidase,chloroplastic [Capsicum baccatum]
MSCYLDFYHLKLAMEIWNSPYSNDSFPIYAEDIDAGPDASPSTAMLSEVAQLLKITIVGGSIPEHSGDKLYKICRVFDTDGKLKAKHKKVSIHFSFCGSGYNANYGNTESGYPGNYYPASYGVNPMNPAHPVQGGTEGYSQYGHGPGAWSGYDLQRAQGPR